MAMLAIACALALQLGDPCTSAPSYAPEPRSSAFADVISDRELDQIYGAGIEIAGLDREREAARARSVDVAFSQARTFDQTRELFDNWNVQVAVPLIAAALAGRSQ